MTMNRRKKNSRQRGSHTHGWGSMKKHRGAGNRGGRGNAGSGKRADAKKPSNWQRKRVFGKHGFVSKKGSHGSKVNVSYFEDNLISLLSQKKATEENGVVVVDAKKLGIAKVLGKGVVRKKFKITVGAATKKAIESVKKSGGDIILPVQTEAAAEKAET